MKNLPKRRLSLRLTGYDYSQPGLYFTTIVCQNRSRTFGFVENGEMILNDAGKMVRDVWLSLPDRFPGLILDEFIVMPDHFHGIIILLDQSNVPVEASLVDASSLVDARFEHIRAGTSPAPTIGANHNPTIGTNHTPTIGDIIGAFKSITTLEYIRGVEKHGWPAFDGKIWQRNYYDRIIRNEREMEAIRKYVADNPICWEQDTENP